MLRLLVTLGFLFFAFPSYAQTFYWVSNLTGADTNDCKTIKTACKTINHAYGLTIAGDYVEVLQGGVYTDTTAPIYLNHGGSGWSTNGSITNAGGFCTSPITIEGYAFQPGRPIVAGTQGAARAGAIASQTITQNGTTFDYPLRCIVVQNLELAGWQNELSYLSIIQNATASGQSWQTRAYIDLGVELDGGYANTTATGVSGSTAATCSITSGSAIITCSATNSLPYVLYVTDPLVSGVIPAGATATIASSTNLTLSTNATATVTGAVLTFNSAWYDTTVTQTCNVTSGSPTLACTATSLLPTNMVVSGVGIPANTLASVTSATTLQMTGGLATATSAGTLGFTSPTNHIVFNNLYVHDFPGGGIGSQNGDYFTVTKNVVTSNAFSNPNEGSGISLYHLTDSDQTSGMLRNVLAQNFVSSNTTLVMNRALPLYQPSAICTAGTGCMGNYVGVTSFCSDGGTSCNFGCYGTSGTSPNPCPTGITSTLNYLMTAFDVTTACIPPNTVINYGAYGGPGNTNPYIILSNNITHGYGCGVFVGDTLAFGYATDGNGIIIDDDCRAQSTPQGVCYANYSSLVSNISTNNGGAGFQCGPTSINCFIQFNTSYMNQTGAYNVNNSCAPGEIYVVGAYGFEVQNNIVVAGSLVPTLWDNSGGGTPTGQQCPTGGAGTPSAWNNNLIYGGIAGNQYHPLPGVNNVLANPQLISPSPAPTLADFRLLPNSPAINAASVAQRNIDFFGNAPVSSKDSLGATAFLPCGSAAYWTSAPNVAGLSAATAGYCKSTGVGTYNGGGQGSSK